MITFLRTRPAETVNELTATTRRKEGTTALEVEAITQAAVSAAVAGGVLPVSEGLSDGLPAAWIIRPTDLKAFLKMDVAGYRVTVVDEGPREIVLDAVARTRAAYLRTGRSRVADATSLVDLPGVSTVVSVFTDTVADAIDAVSEGARDLVLRDWDVQQIGELRDALSEPLVERTALPVGIPIGLARQDLESTMFTAWLNQIDGSSAARPRYGWAPGIEDELPVPAGRLSAEWLDEKWASGSAPPRLEGAGDLLPILERSLAGTPPTRDELVLLFSARGDQIDAVAYVADQIRRRVSGETVTYVINRNINYTNMCYFKCGFCAFSKGPKSLNLRGDPYLLGVPEIVARTKEAMDRGATEVCLQGGIHPEFTGDFYVGVVEAIKAEMPNMHIHGFTPLEVWQGAETLGISVREFLGRLAAAGLGTLPGTAAEILDDDVREYLCPDKIRTSQWADVMTAASELGLRSTATVMFGHIDGPESWANHYEVLRQVQRKTGVFTEFVPLPFVHMGAPIWLRGGARPGPTWDETLLIHAVARIAFDGLIDNIQASWVKTGLDGAKRLLQAGCNDMGGTLMDEIITRSAGASHGTELDPGEFEDTIREIGRVPAQRTTLYGLLSNA